MTKTKDESRQYWIDNAQWQIKQARIARANNRKSEYLAHMAEVRASQDALFELDAIPPSNGEASV